MTVPPDLRPLAQALRQEQGGLVDRWLEAFRRSTLRLPRPFDEQEIRQLASPIVESLADALHTREAETPERLVDLVPGHPDLREVEKSVAFIGGRLATTATSGYDVAALILALREALGPYTEGETRKKLWVYVEWIAVLAQDSYSSAKELAERERVRDELENGTPVIQVVPELPAAFLVGKPDSGVLESIFSRLILLVVRVGAASAIVDASGLSVQDAPGLLQALEKFLTHRKIAGKVEILAVGLDAEPEKRWLELAKRAGTSMLMLPHFDRAVDRGLRVAGYRLVRS